MCVKDVKCSRHTSEQRSGLGLSIWKEQKCYRKWIEREFGKDWMLLALPTLPFQGGKPKQMEELGDGPHAVFLLWRGWLENKHKGMKQGFLSWFWCPVFITQITPVNFQICFWGSVPASASGTLSLVWFHEECWTIFTPAGSNFTLPDPGSEPQVFCLWFLILHCLPQPHWRLTMINCGWLPSSLWPLILSCCSGFLKPVLSSYIFILSGTFKRRRGDKRKSLGFLKGLQCTLSKISLRLCALSFVYAWGMDTLLLFTQTSVLLLWCSKHQPVVTHSSAPACLCFGLFLGIVFYPLALVFVFPFQHWLQPFSGTAQKIF